MSHTPLLFRHEWCGHPPHLHPQLTEGIAMQTVSHSILAPRAPRAARRPVLAALIQVVGTLLGLGLGLNGLHMLTTPEAWYHRIPGVSLTGPMNPHFIRDIGCAYLVASTGLVWGLLRPARAWLAAAMGTAFVLMHAGVHLYEVAAGLCGWSAWWQAVPGVTLPALLALLLCVMTRVMGRA
jgi:hypothetical protein